MQAHPSVRRQVAREALSLALAEEFSVLQAQSRLYFPSNREHGSRAFTFLEDLGIDVVALLLGPDDQQPVDEGLFAPKEENRNE